MFAIATPEAAAKFFAERWPEAAVVCEAAGRFHQDLLGARRARPWELLRPSVWLRGFRAHRNGHRSGKRGPDVWRLGGAMLVRGERVLWVYRAKDFADHFDPARVPRA